MIEMRRHTLQEWADFTGLPAAMDEDGEAYLYRGIPIKGRGVWSGAAPILIPFKWISGGERHDWEVLVMPSEEVES